MSTISMPTVMCSCNVASATSSEDAPSTVWMSSLLPRAYKELHQEWKV